MSTVGGLKIIVVGRKEDQREETLAIRDSLQRGTSLFRCALVTEKTSEIFEEQWDVFFIKASRWNGLKLLGEIRTRQKKAVVVAFEFGGEIEEPKRWQKAGVDALASRLSIDSGLKRETIEAILAARAARVATAKA